VAAQQLADRFLNIGVGMDGQSHYYVRPSLDDLADRATDRFEVAAPALSSVRRHQNQPAVLECGFFNTTSIQDGRVGRTKKLQCVDYRVPSYRASLDGKARSLQIGLRLRSRRHQDFGNRIDDLAIGLFREGMGKVAAAQSCLHMNNRYVCVEPGERRGHCRGCVALHENEVSPAVRKATAERPQQVTSGIRQRPADRFDVQFTVRGKPKRGQRRTADLAMLPEVMTRTKKSSPLSLSAFTTGASLIASGRVPTITSQFTADEAFE